jgi:D-alanine-D-alanine ligase
LARRADDLAMFFVYDRPERVDERPGLARTYFAQRCVSDSQLTLMLDAFRSVGAFVELFHGERPFIDALADTRLQSLPHALKVAYNGVGWGIATDGFKAGRKALIPLLADAYGLICANSAPYPCVLTLNKFDSFLVLQALGVKTPRSWHFRPESGWISSRPPDGTRVIAKSTYEAWSVGVTDDSVFFWDETGDERVAAVAERIAQPVTVQQFIPGVEVYVPILSCPELVVTPPVEVVMAKAPGDPDAIMTADDNLCHGSAYRLFEGSPALLLSLEQSARRIFEIFGLEGLARIDFRIDEAEIPWVFDVAIEPAVESESSAYVSMAKYGFAHAEFLRAVVAASLATQGLLHC